MWQTINILNNKKPYNPINTLNINNQIIDNKQKIANAIAHHFYQASSSAYYTPAFLPRKEEAELSIPNFATGGVNSDYNTEFTLDELLFALKYCKGSSPGPDNISYIMLQHLGHHSITKLLLLYNKIWTTHTILKGLCSYHPNSPKDWTP